MNRRLASAIVLAQTLTIVGLLYWLVRESEANPFLGLWASQNLPFLGVVLNQVVLFIAMGTVFVVTGVWILLSEREPDPGPLQASSIQDPAPKPSSAETELVRPARPYVVHESQPFYETIQTRHFFLIMGLATQAVSLWFITAGILRIAEFPADSLSYAGQLPLTYWWGLGATLALTTTRTLVRTRFRTGIEVSSLLLLALYTIGLPSFVYENPRILDSYQHLGNSLGLVNNQGWVNAPIWYLRQFPGAYTFFAQLVMVAGIAPFDLLKYYPVGLSSILVLFVYVISRMFSPNYSLLASGVFVGGVWFQLHLSPQSLGLVLYLGLLLVMLKTITNNPRTKLWVAIAILSAPVFVASHPVTTLVTIAGFSIFLASVPFFSLSSIPGQIVQTLAKSMTKTRLTEAFLLGQAIVIIGLLYTLYQEARSNPLLAIWISQNYSIVGIVVAASLTVLGAITVAVVKLELERRRTSARAGTAMAEPVTLFRKLLPTFGSSFAFLFACTLVWWSTFASEARRFAQSIGERAIELGLSSLATEAPSLPINPSASYYITAALAQAVSLTVWLLGLLAVIFSRGKLRTRESMLVGLLLAAIGTVPLTFFAKVDLLQRSYLFALFPTVILLSWLLERRTTLSFGSFMLHRHFRTALVLVLVFFLAVMPVTRNGVDPFEYIPQSSLAMSNLAASLKEHSILFLHPGEYGWRFYSMVNGNIEPPRLEQTNLTSRPGGFVKTGSTLDNFNLSFTPADNSSDYIMLSDYYENLFILRLGPDSPLYVGQKSGFETIVSQQFNLVYSTGTDRLYASRHLP